MAEYNGYTNKETWSASLEYDDMLYRYAMEYIEEHRTYEEFKTHMEALIQGQVLRALKEPNAHSLASEFLCASLRAINYEELAQSAWQEAMHDIY